MYLEDCFEFWKIIQRSNRFASSEFKGLMKEACNIFSSCLLFREGKYYMLPSLTLWTLENKGGSVKTSVSKAVKRKTSNNYVYYFYLWWPSINPSFISLSVRLWRKLLNDWLIVILREILKNNQLFISWARINLDSRATVCRPMIYSLRTPGSRLPPQPVATTIT